MWAERLLPQSTSDFTPEPAEPWKEEALCAETDPEAFFPDKGGSTKAAKKICAACDVQLECLGYALQNDERYGIWGGASPRERAAMKRQRRES